MESTANDDMATDLETKEQRRIEPTPAPEAERVFETGPSFAGHGTAGGQRARDIVQRLVGPERMLARICETNLS